MNQTLWYYLNDYWNDIADPRVNNWPLISGGLWKIALILLCYLLTTLVLLPRFMKNRQALKLHYPLLVYNTTMVALNAYFFLYSLKSIDYGTCFLDFEYPSINDTSERVINFLENGWYFMLTRYFDWADTVFFVLRKKDSQITFLHLYHHTVVPLLGWVCFKYNALIPGVRLFSLINSLIHVIMYGYYALASFGPVIQKYLWWKKYLTLMQITQFVIYGIYVSILYFKQIDYPMSYFITTAVQVPVFLYMFCDFYFKSYRRSTQTRVKIH